MGQEADAIRIALAVMRRASICAASEPSSARATCLFRACGSSVRATEETRKTLFKWLDDPTMKGSEYLWPSCFHDRPHLSTRQYARLVRDWVSSVGLEPTSYGTHSMRRTKVAPIYRKTGNLRAVQLLLGHTKMDSTVRYFGVEPEDALAIAEAIDL
jgi:site-specific recombinase XerD